MKIKNVMYTYISEGLSLANYKRTHWFMGKDGAGHWKVMSPVDFQLSTPDKDLNVTSKRMQWLIFQTMNPNKCTSTC